MAAWLVNYALLNGMVWKGTTSGGIPVGCAEIRAGNSGRVVANRVNIHLDERVVLWGFGLI